jgi:hypothetical protein
MATKTFNFDVPNTILNNDTTTTITTKPVTTRLKNPLTLPNYLYQPPKTPRNQNPHYPINKPTTRYLKHHYNAKNNHHQHLKSNIFWYIIDLDDYCDAFLYKF